MLFSMRGSRLSVALASRAALAGAAIWLAGCQLLFPTPIEGDADTRPSGAVRALGNAYLPGEHLKAEVYLDGVVAGVGDLRAGARCLADGRSVVPVVSTGRSAGLIKMFQSASSDVRTLVDAETSTPIEAAWDAKLGARRQTIDQLFGESSFRFKQTREIPEKPTRTSFGDLALPFDGTPHDGHTSLGYLRRWTPEPGARGHIYAVYGRYVWRADVTHRGQETITTPLGTQRAARLDGVATKLMGKNLKPSSLTPLRPFTIWIGDDERRVPLRILVETSLAKISIDVVEYDVDASVAQAPLRECEPRVDAKAVDRGVAARKQREEQRRRKRADQAAQAAQAAQADPAEPVTRGEDGEPETEDEKEEREDREALDRLLRR